MCGDSTRDRNRHVQPLDGSQPPYTLYEQHFGDLPTSIFSSLISSVARSAAFPSVYILPNHTRVHSCAHAINSNGHTFRQSTLLHKQRTTARKLTIIIRIYSLLIHQCVAVCRGADKSLARPGRKQATATEDFEFHIHGCR